MTKRSRAESEALHAGPDHQQRDVDTGKIIEFELAVVHGSPARQQENGLADAGVATQRNPVAPASGTGGAATHGGAPAEEPRLDACACETIASAKQASVKYLNQSIETADLIAAYRTLNKFGWVRRHIDPETGCPMWTPAEHALACAEEDLNKGCTMWTPEELDAILAEEVKLRRAQGATPAEVDAILGTKAQILLNQHYDGRLELPEDRLTACLAQMPGA